MSDDAQRWKEKYLKSIEQQEKLERRWNARLDLLRRGLVRSTLAAEGTDRAVDQCMKEMREVVRTDDMDAALAALLPRLEKAVLDSEQRRETRIEQMSTALTSLVSQLQKLPLPREVSRPLKNFAKQLDGRVGQAREIPLLLGELSGLQGKALSQLESPRSRAAQVCCSACLVVVTLTKRLRRPRLRRLRWWQPPLWSSRWQRLKELTRPRPRLGSKSRPHGRPKPWSRCPRLWSRSPLLSASRPSHSRKRCPR